MVVVSVVMTVVIFVIFPVAPSAAEQSGGGGVLSFAIRIAPTDNHDDMMRPTRSPITAPCMIKSKVYLNILSPRYDKMKQTKMHDLLFSS